jgi:hypothetical protein
MPSDYTRRIVPPPEEVEHGGAAMGSSGGDGANGIEYYPDRAHIADELPEVLNNRLDNPEGWLWSVDGVDNVNGDVDLIAGVGIVITPDNTLKTITIAATGGGGDNYTVMCSANDTTPGYLEDKIVVSAGVNSSGILELTT